MVLVDSPLFSVYSSSHVHKHEGQAMIFKPCPFCGVTGVKKGSWLEFHHKKGCWFPKDSHVYLVDKTAIESWNKRWHLPKNSIGR